MQINYRENNGNRKATKNFRLVPKLTSLYPSSHNAQKSHNTITDGKPKNKQSRTKIKFHHKNLKLPLN